MQIHADFSRRALVHAAELSWLASPQPGVERRMLDRIGDEVARATSLVRYAPDSLFPAHSHAGGEEYLVLEGVFQDEKGDHPTGRYVRNPPGSRHTPGSTTGAVIFVKLRQFDPHDQQQIEVDILQAPQQRDPNRAGVSLQMLHADSHELVQIEHWQASQPWQESFPYGAELLMLSGALAEGKEHLRRWSWLRLPAGAQLDARIAAEGAVLWIKRYLAPMQMFNHDH
ncbi:cupin domain-containing protein [Neisseriaceae bacterium TC5R-5]|nr:cupin domain-containing protein [Neisseriaceae bacterium TC5R-5]